MKSFSRTKCTPMECTWKFSSFIIRAVDSLGRWIAWLPNMFLQWKAFDATACVCFFFYSYVIEIEIDLPQTYSATTRSKCSEQKKKRCDKSGMRCDYTLFPLIYMCRFYVRLFVHVLYMCVRVCICVGGERGGWMGFWFGKCGPIWTWPQLITAAADAAAIAVVDYMVHVR